MKKVFCFLLKSLTDPDTWFVMGLIAISQIFLYVICFYLTGDVCSFFLWLWFLLFEFIPLAFTYFLIKEYIKKKSQPAE